MEGLKRRMGQDWRPNKAITKALMLPVLDEADIRVEASTSPGERNWWIVFHMYAMLCTVPQRMQRFTPRPGWFESKMECW
jgi:hypothetical protein